MPKLLRWLLSAAFSAVLVIILTPSVASAHAVLVDSDPRDGSRVERAPERVTLRFNEPVRIIDDGLRVTSVDGRRMDTGRPQTTDGGSTVIIDVDHHGPATGSYLVSWQLVSADSHAVSGSIRYGVGQDPGPPADAPATGPGTAEVLAGIGAGIGYLGLIAAIGCLLAGRLSWPSMLRSPRLPPLLTAGSSMIIFGAGLELESAAQLTGGVTAALSPGAAGSWQAWLLVARMGLTALLLPLGLLALRSIRAGRDPIMIIGGWALVALSILVTVAAHGHAAAGELRVAAAVAGVVHLAGMACWAGGLVLLILLIRPRLAGLPRAAGRVIGSWSRVAYGSLAALVLSGELLAWRTVQPVDALWHTGYGRTLVIKLGLVAGLLVTAVLARRFSRPNGRPRTPRLGRLLLLAEMMIMVAVISAATVLGRTPPAADSYGPPAVLTAGSGDDQLRIRIAGTRRGPQTITVTATDPTGDPVRLASLSGSLSSPDQQISHLDIRFARRGDQWRSTDAVAPVPGRWRLQLTAADGSGPAYVSTVDYRVW